jgi:predicted cobalt transporter CbtA
MKPYIIRGAVAGLIGAVAAALTLLLLGENAIKDAIALEDAASGGHGEAPMFTRGVQVGFGAVGILVEGLLLGMIFGIVYVAVRHRLGGVPEWQRARRLAALGFLNLCLVPWLKYPPNPPAVGDPDTVNERTIAYLSLIAIGLIASVVAVRAVDWCRRREWPDHLIGPSAVALWVAIVAVAYLLLPANPDAITVPAKLIWRFRLASAGGQLALWSLLGVAFGWLTVRAEGRKVFPRRSGHDDTREPSRIRG